MLIDPLAPPPTAPARPAVVRWAWQAVSLKAGRGTAFQDLAGGQAVKPAVRAAPEAIDPASAVARIGGTEGGAATRTATQQPETYDSEAYVLRMKLLGTRVDVRV